MENKKDLPQKLTNAIESSELEKVSGGGIIHFKRNEKDVYYVLPDPNFGEAVQEHPLGSVGMMMNGKFSGPYETKEEAIQAAVDSGCTNIAVIERDDYIKKFKHSKI